MLKNILLIRYESSIRIKKKERDNIDILFNKGTIVGAFLGHAVLLLVLEIKHHYGRAFVHIILQFLYFLPVIFLQQIPMFGYSGKNVKLLLLLIVIIIASVAGLTYLTIFIGQYKLEHGDIVYACMRGFFILVVFIFILTFILFIIYLFINQFIF